MWPDHVEHRGQPVTGAVQEPAASSRVVADAIAAAGIAANRVELEITKSMLLQDSRQDARDPSAACATLGVRISMDDFGTGYPRSATCRSFSFDKIKIDRCFLADTSEDGGGLAVIRAILRIGAPLGLAVIAEGVETVAQVELARREGCAEVQGFLFSPPVGAAEIGWILCNPLKKSTVAASVAA